MKRKLEGLSAVQIYDELLKTPKSSWTQMISQLPATVKSDLVQILSKKKKECTGSSDNSTLKSNLSTNTAHIYEVKSQSLEISNKVNTSNEVNNVQDNNINLYQESLKEKEHINPDNNYDFTKKDNLDNQKLKLSFQEPCNTTTIELNKKFLNLKVSTYSPIYQIISRAMYIAGDDRKILKDANNDEITVKCVQSYLNIWIALVWDNLTLSNSKISGKLNNKILKNLLKNLYKEEIDKLNYDYLISKVAHKHFVTGSNVISPVSSVENKDISVTQDIESITCNLSTLSNTINTRFENRLKLRDIRTRNMPSDSYKEFALLREKNFRPSLNTLHDWLNITWNTTYNSGIKDSKITDIPSGCLQIFSFLINDIISSIVEDALQVALSEIKCEQILNEYKSNEYKCNIKEDSFIKRINELNKISSSKKFDDLLEYYKNLENIKGSSKNNMIELRIDHYLAVIINKINEKDINLLYNSCNPTKSYELTLSHKNSIIESTVIINRISELNEVLTSQIIRGSSNWCISSFKKYGIEDDKISENYQSDDVKQKTDEVNDMFDAILESAIKDCPIDKVFPMGISDNFGMFALTRLRRCIEISQDPEDLTKILNTIFNEWEMDTSKSEDDKSIEIQEAKSISINRVKQLNKYMDIAHKVLAISNLLKKFSEEMM
ncbi:hypothetical protein cand_002790 [Cryptosporidium andersoni]|uniref:Uncharacterized protein n=1 Tax=Cryptosporidium andersoni TaxID=117008 RepID=A0A1J4MSE6_9CRYT|nr:hypothetical protein cand_002790 [Cryptosporidium andersoni]